MGRLKTLITGTLLGAGGMYVGLQYHVLQAEEGFLIVPRAPQQRMQDAYADIRDWDAATWTARSRLALAVTENGRGDLITEGVASNLADDLRESITPPHEHENVQLPSHGWEPSTTTSTPAQPRATSPVHSSPPTTPVAAPPARSRFLPLADLFGFGGDRSTTQTAPVTPASAPQVMPAGSNRTKGVEILPSPGHVEMLRGPGDVQLGPSGPIPNQQQRIDRRRTEVTEGWQPLTGNLN